MPRMRSLLPVALATCLFAGGVWAQTPSPPAASDAPSYQVGVLLFADYTRQANPEARDADGNEINPSSFNVGRAYINVTGKLNHLIEFRITPDIVRETGSGSSISGSYTFRLKFAYAQLNLDDWLTKGSWLQLGQQPAPYTGFIESIYRYRFQGQIFVDREGYVATTDNGFSGHYNFPGNYGDVHVGYFNGEGFTKAEANDQKALQGRVAFRPFPENASLKGLRAGVFYDGDNYLRHADKTRLVPFVTYETKRGNAGFEYLKASDQTSTRLQRVDASGFSVWVTPKLIHGFEALIRHDQLKPNTDLDGKKKRDVLGIAYWIPKLDKVTAAVMLDGEEVKYEEIAKPDETRYGLHLLISF